MQGIVIGLAIPWVVGALISATAPVDWNAEKVKLAAAVTGAIHNAWVDAELISVGDAVIDGVAKLSQDKPDMVAALQALAAGNKDAAVSALETALKSVLSPQLAALLS